MSHVMANLSEKLGLQFLLHYTARYSSIDEDTLITLKLVDVRASSILLIMLEEHDCTYHIEDGIVMFYAADDIQDCLGREVFDVFDANIKDERLIDMITHVVDPESWEDHSGYGRIQYVDGRLIVCQSEKNIREIRDLLIANEFLVADGMD